MDSCANLIPVVGHFHGEPGRLPFHGGAAGTFPSTEAQQATFPSTETVWVASDLHGQAGKQGIPRAAAALASRRSAVTRDAPNPSVSTTYAASYPERTSRRSKHR